MSVLLVVLYHFGVDTLSAGFLGVDVFFVISGFLMACLYDQKNKADFFVRRAKRLLPAYFLICLVLILAAAVITLPSDFEQVVGQVYFATGFSSNFGFWLLNSYFSKAEFKPLLHLWSLGVEIQFYLLLPLLVWVFAKTRVMLIATILASLILCFIMISVSPKTAFFLLPFRLWEFLIGYYAALNFTNLGNVRIKTYPWVGGLGVILLVVISMLNIDGVSLNVWNGHPATAALVVCLFTSLALVHGLPKSIENSFIGGVLEKVGEYSYSIYLVHFPVLVLVMYSPFSGTNMQIGTFNQAVVIILLSIVGSFLLYNLVERRGRKSVFSLRSIIVFILVIFLLIYSAKQYHGIIYSENLQRVFGAISDRTGYRCGKMIRILEPNATSCDLSKDIQDPVETVLLVGNSHADSIKSIFATEAGKSNVKVRFVVPSNSLMKGGLLPSAIINEAKIRGVGSIVVHSSMNSIAIDTILQLAKLAREDGILVSFIFPIPTWNENIPRALYNNIKLGTVLPRQSIDDYENDVALFKEGLLGAVGTNFTMYEVGHAFCAPNCIIINEAGNPLYFDNEHLTLSGGEVLRGVFKVVVNDVLDRSLE